MPFDFSGKTALVTGGTKGIGAAIVDALALAGAHVIINSENEQDCHEKVKQVVENGGRATAYPTDLMDGGAVHDMAGKAWNELGSIDALFCNAGITGKKRFGDDGYEIEVSNVFNLNLHHARILSQYIAPQMADRGQGSIVLTASLSALRGNGNIGVYSLTKAALVQLAKDMAVKFGPQGVRVNSVAPGLIATGWEGAILSNPERAQRRMQMTPLRRIGQPQEIADAALFLASDRASFITGQCLVVDGGTSITDGS